jgi:hypothetical protein
MKKPKKAAVLLIPFFAVLFLSCAPSLKTEKIDMPKAGNRGPLTIVVKRSSEDVTAAEASRTKQILSEKFKLAGFSHVAAASSANGAAQSIEIMITKYEHANSTQTGCAASAAACIYICPLFAPCAFLPGYHNPQFEIIAEVSAHKNGHLAFEKVMSEKSVSKANLVNVGNVEFKDKMEELTLHNFAVALVTQWDKH